MTITCMNLKYLKNVYICKPAQLNYTTIIPSKKLYFGRYPYKIDFVGDKVTYDPLDHFMLNQFMFDKNINNRREVWNYNQRSIYFRHYVDVANVCLFFKDLVKSVSGPVSSTHIKLLNNDSEIRENLYFKKYDTRLEFVGRIDRKHKDKILEVVQTNLTDYRWSSLNFTWYYNYLFCHSSDIDELLPWFKLAFGNSIYGVTRAIPYSDL